jgi:hypothetical protein
MWAIFYIVHNIYTILFITYLYMSQKHIVTYYHPYYIKYACMESFKMSS